MKVQINLSDKVRRAAIAQGHELPATMVLAIDPASLPEDLREHVAPILPLFEPGRVAPLLHGSRNPADEGVLEDWARAGMPRTPWQCSVDPAVGTEAVLRAWIADRAAKERSYAAEKACHEAADYRTDPLGTLGAIRSPPRRHRRRLPLENKDLTGELKMSDGTFDSTLGRRTTRKKAQKALCANSRDAQNAPNETSGATESATGRHRPFVVSRGEALLEHFTAEGLERARGAFGVEDSLEAIIQAACTGIRARERYTQTAPTSPGKAIRGKAAAIAAIAAGGAVEVCGDGSGGHYIMADRYRLTSADIPAEVWARIVSEYKARCAEAEARRAAEEEAKRKGKAAFVAEAKTWADEHGSDRLRKGLAQDYDMTRLYVTERAAADHEGFVVDWKDACEWDRRSSPSERALDVAAEHDGEVVWLETLPDGAETAEEAVVIREYLGRYDLVMPLGDPQA